MAQPNSSLIGNSYDGSSIEESSNVYRLQIVQSGGGGGGGMDALEQRVATLEEGQVAIRGDIRSLSETLEKALPELATKSDVTAEVANARSTIVAWVFGTFLASLGTLLAILAMS